MAFSFLEYLFVFRDIHVFYANEESNDVIGGSTKTAQHLNENNSRNIKQRSLNLAPVFNRTTYESLLHRQFKQENKIITPAVQTRRTNP